MPQPHREEIVRIVEEHARKHNAKVLYISRVGSREYGYARLDSDWDIRFVFVQDNPMNYIGPVGTTEVIQQLDIKTSFGTMEIVGYDIRKFLGLVLKSNMTVYEWLRSETRYLVRPIFFKHMLPIYKEMYSCKKLMFDASIGTAVNMIKTIEKRKDKKLKEYLFAIHRLLIANELTKTNGGDYPSLDLFYLAEIYRGKCSDYLEHLKFLYERHLTGVLEGEDIIDNFDSLIYELLMEVREKEKTLFRESVTNQPFYSSIRREARKKINIFYDEMFFESRGISRVLELA